jgi:hypothetical protein
VFEKTAEKYFSRCAYSCKKQFVQKVGQLQKDPHNISGILDIKRMV